MGPVEGGIQANHCRLGLVTPNTHTHTHTMQLTHIAFKDYSTSFSLLQRCVVLLYVLVVTIHGILFLSEQCLIMKCR